MFDLQYFCQIFIKFNNLGVFWNPHDEQIQKKHPQIVEFDEDLVEILKIQDNTSFSSLLWNEKKINFEMILVVFNLQ